MKDMMGNSQDSSQKGTVSLNISDYPDIKNIGEGDDVTITGKVVKNDGETVEVECDDVQSEMGADKEKMSRMSAQPGMMNQNDNSGDQ